MPLTIQRLRELLADLPADGEVLWELPWAFGPRTDIRPKEADFRIMNGKFIIIPPKK